MISRREKEQMDVPQIRDYKCLFREDIRFDLLGINSEFSILF